MRTLQSVPHFLLALVFVLHAETSNAGELPEAIRGIDEVVPKMCRMLELEKNMYAVIRESGQTPEQFFARSDTDPDQNVQKVLRITKEIQIVKGDLTVPFGKLKAIVATLKPEDQATFKQQFDLKAKQCSRQ